MFQVLPFLLLLLGCVCVCMLVTPIVMGRAFQVLRHLLCTCSRFPTTSRSCLPPVDSHPHTQLFHKKHLNYRKACFWAVCLVNIWDAPPCGRVSISVICGSKTPCDSSADLSTGKAGCRKNLRPDAGKPSCPSLSRLHVWKALQFQTREIVSWNQNNPLRSQKRSDKLCSLLSGLKGKSNEEGWWDLVLSWCHLLLQRGS